eukprot:TRINITY_DN2101_c0_g1_i2.p1 TRINITY_DN2101_c0_g1~~TRINITY_DN2101_c0_g1_i2.p1  ORF type:complete len:550 (+),score=118.53 TRINITY_DN2101_c0_g1_i2:112-1650(+)
MDFSRQTLPTILCCMCGTPIPSNPSNMCGMCLRTQVDITEGITKQLTVQYCKSCGSYLTPPTQWVFIEPESKELLAFCLKRIRGLNKVRLIDASFVWTEPHSKRLKVKLTIQKEVFTGTILQQSFLVEYVLNTYQCDKCTKAQTPHTWVAVAQVRQKVPHKRTFYYLEQLLLRHSAHLQPTSMKELPDGLDFYFNTRSHAQKLVDFLQQVIPITVKTGKKLISQDDSNNTYNYKYTFSVEIAPVCREDLICLPPKLRTSLGNVSPIVLCFKVSNVLHLVDTFTGATYEINKEIYARGPFTGIANSRQLVSFIVLDISHVRTSNSNNFFSPFLMVDVQIARLADFGTNDITFQVRSHLGKILKVGDTVLGYEVSSLNFNNSDFNTLNLNRQNIPDIVLVKKERPSKKDRIWKLKRLETEKEEEEGSARSKKEVAEKEREQQDYQHFLDDLEADRDYRSGINLYPDQESIQRKQRRREEMETETDEDDPDAVKLEELLSEMTIQDTEMGEQDDQ